MAQTPNVIGNVVVQRLKELDLPATPDNYERLYYDVSGLPRPESAEHSSQIDCEELLATLREMVSDVSEKTAYLSQDLGEKNQHLQASVTSLKSSREKNEILRLLSLVVTQAGSIHSTVQVSHTELQETRRALEGMQADLSETRQMLNEDALTGTLNRRGMDQCLGREVARAHRTGEALTMAILDLDHFKKINDNHGHEAGDQMLMHFATLVKSVMRKSDVAVRYGGEEFILLLPETDTRGAQFVLARLQQVLTRSPLMYEGSQIQATFSAGIATLKGEENGHALLRRADTALYEAKNAGRNCLRVAV